MVTRTIALCLATGVAGFAMTGPLAVASPLAANRADAVAIDISAAQERKQTAPRGRAAPRAIQGAPRVNVVRTPRATVARTPRVNVVRQPRVVGPGGSVSVKRNVGGSAARIAAPGLPGAPKAGKGITRPIAAPVAGQALGPGKLKLGPGKIGPVGPGKLQAGPGLVKPANFQVVKINNKVWPIAKGPKMIWWGGGWKKFIPITALGVILVGGAYYYPDGYVSIAQPSCGGITPDGCTLNWQMVAFEDGGSEWQCVQYCPRSGPPPAQTVALVAPPPAPPNARCELAIFAEPGLAGPSAPTGEDQPRLGEAGWRNQIASIDVLAGTWDFFTDEEFAGENMRLPPGRYPQLAPDWTKRIGSFMCVQPS